MPPLQPTLAAGPCSEGSEGHPRILGSRRRRQRPGQQLDLMCCFLVLHWHSQYEQGRQLVMDPAAPDLVVAWEVSSDRGRWLGLFGLTAMDDGLCLEVGR